MSAPVVLFAYKRADHVNRTLEALARCPEAISTDLLAFCDGPKGEADAAAVEETRRTVKSARGFGSVEVVERDGNYGLARNVKEGLDEALGRGETSGRFDRAIVMEDDIVAGPRFLSFMNAALEAYRDDPCVFSASAYLYPLSLPAGYAFDTFFASRFSCWGWATWSDRWSKVERELPSKTDFLADRTFLRALSAASADLPEMLLDRIEGKNSSWSIEVALYCVQKGFKNIYPTMSQALNEGFDGTGTHCVPGDVDVPLVDCGDGPWRFAQNIDPKAEEALVSVFRNSAGRKFKNFIRYGKIF